VEGVVDGVAFDGRVLQSIKNLDRIIYSMLYDYSFSEDTRTINKPHWNLMIYKKLNNEKLITLQNDRIVGGKYFETDIVCNLQTFLHSYPSPIFHGSWQSPQNIFKNGKSLPNTFL
jgi:hypothetical protein